MGRMLTDVRHVVWDWNGTLIDDASLCVDVMDALLRARGLPGLSADRYAAIFRFPVRDYYADLGFSERFEVVGREFIEGYQRAQVGCGLRARATEVLAALSGRGITQSVLSASERWRLDEQARRLGVHGHFEALVGLDDHHAHGKIEEGRAWLAASGRDPSTVLLVGDTDHDVEVAAALGVRCALVPSGHQSEARLRASGAPVLRGLADLLGDPG